MKGKNSEFPLRIKSGSVIIKIYRSTNKGRPSYFVAFMQAGKRRLKAFVDLEEAKTEARSIAHKLAQGELDVVHLKNSDRVAYMRACEALRPSNMPLELAALEYAEAFKVLGERASVVEAAKDYAKRHLHALSAKTVAEAVEEMIRVKKAEGASKDYLKVLKFYLSRLAEAFHSQLKAITSCAVWACRLDLLHWSLAASVRSKPHANYLLHDLALLLRIPQ